MESVVCWFLQNVFPVVQLTYALDSIISGIEQEYPTNTYVTHYEWQNWIYICAVRRFEYLACTKP